jgi:hypothetical protein
MPLTKVGTKQGGTAFGAIQALHPTFPPMGIPYAKDLFCYKIMVSIWQVIAPRNNIWSACIPGLCKKSFCRLRRQNILLGDASFSRFRESKS